MKKAPSGKGPSKLSRPLADPSHEAASDALPDDNLRFLVLRMTRRMTVERLITILCNVHEALKSGRVRRAERVASQCKLKPFVQLLDVVMGAARSGHTISALNMVFRSEMFAYETTFDHAEAFLAYRESILARRGLKPKRSRRSRTHQRRSTT
jgi:hypothetical protein